MQKLLAGTMLLLAIAGCAKKEEPPPISGGSGGRSPGGIILTGAPHTSLTLTASAGTSLRGDSVVVMGGQSCVLVTVEVVPKTVPPTYTTRVVCSPKAAVGDSVVVMGGQYTALTATTPPGTAPTYSLRGDSVVVMGGQECVLMDVPVIPATVPPTYTTTIRCFPRK